MLIESSPKTERVKVLNKTEGEYEYQAVYGDTYALFNDASKEHNHLFAVKKDNCLLQFQLEETNACLTIAEEYELIYPEIFPEVDLKYEFLAESIKETLIIKDASAKHAFSFKVLSEHVDTHFNEDGSIDCIHSLDGEKLWTIAAPIAWDAENNPLDVNMAYSENSYSLEVETDSNTVYPIYLDPTVTIPNNYLNVLSLRKDEGNAGSRIGTIDPSQFGFKMDTITIKSYSADTSCYCDISGGISNPLVVMRNQTLTKEYVLTSGTIDVKAYSGKGAYSRADNTLVGFTTADPKYLGYSTAKTFTATKHWIVNTAFIWSYTQVNTKNQYYTAVSPSSITVNGISKTMTNFEVFPGDTVTVNYAGTNVLFLVTFAGTLIADPIPVSNFTNAAVTSDTASFSWSAATGATSVKIQQSLAGANTWLDSTTTATLTASSISGTVTGLSGGTSYDFRLVVVGGNNAGTSNTISNITTDVAGTPVKVIFDSFRFAASYEARNIDSQRQSIKEMASQNDSYRQIGISDASLYDSNRKTASESILSGDVLRHAVSVTTVDSDLRRKTMAPNEFISDTGRITGSNEILSADTKRDVLSVFYENIDSDTKRTIHNDMTAQTDTGRLLALDQMLMQDTKRDILAHDLIAANTSRNIKFEECYCTEIFNPWDSASLGVEYNEGVTLGPKTTLTGVVPYSMPGVWTVDNQYSISAKVIINNDSTVPIFSFDWKTNGIIYGDTSTGWGSRLYIFIDKDTGIWSHDITENGSGTVTVNLYEYLLSKPLIGEHEILFKYVFSAPVTRPKISITNLKLHHQPVTQQTTAGEVISNPIDMTSLKDGTYKFEMNKIVPAGSEIKLYYSLNGSKTYKEITNFDSFSSMTDLSAASTMNLKAVFSGTVTAIPKLIDVKLYNQVIVTIPVILRIDSRRALRKAVTNLSDTKRRIMAPKSFNSNTDRKLLLINELKSDSHRKTAITDATISDTLRTVFASYSIGGETKRNLLNIIGIETDTKRNTSIPVILDTDTKRTISLKASIVLSDTLRKVIKSHITASELKRISRAEEIMSLDSKREVLTLCTVLNDAMRHITASDNIDTDSKRIILKELLVASELKRDTSLSQMFLSDALRRSSSEEMIQNDSLRIAANFRTLDIETIRRVIKTKNTKPDTNRKTLLPYLLNVDTVRQNLNLIYETVPADTKRYFYRTDTREKIVNGTLHIESPDNWTYSSTQYYDMNLQELAGPGGKLTQIKISASTNLLGVGATYYPNYTAKLHFYDANGKLISSSDNFPNMRRTSYPANIDVPANARTAKIEYKVGYINNLGSGSNIIGILDIWIQTFTIGYAGIPYYLLGDMSRINRAEADVNTDTVRQISLNSYVKLFADTSRNIITPYSSMNDMKRLTRVLDVIHEDTVRKTALTAKMDSDTLRNIILSDSLSYDINRRLTKKDILIANSLRSIGIDTHADAPTIRKLLNNIRVESDTGRKALIDYLIHYNTLRIALSEETESGFLLSDFLRILHKDDRTHSDAQRFTVVPHEVSYDTRRQIIFDIRVNRYADTQRMTCTVEDIITDLLRSVMAGQDYISDTCRIIRTNVSMNTDTERALMKIALLNTDSLRTSRKDIIESIDTKRICIVIKPGVKLYNYNVSVDNSLSFDVEVKTQSVFDVDVATVNEFDVIVKTESVFDLDVATVNEFDVEIN